jgi:hypothetical protein
MRAVVIRESLANGRLPLGLQARIGKSYGIRLDEETPVEILEFDVGRDELLNVAKALSAGLKPRLYYAHIWSPDMLYICFPHMLFFLPKGDAAACELATRAGRLFDIPISQMRFAEMFDTHHPDPRG